MGENEVTASFPVASNETNRASNGNGKVKPGRRTEDAATEGLVRVRALVADLGARESDARRRINEQRGELTELRLRDHRSTLELEARTRDLEEVMRREQELISEHRGLTEQLAHSADRAGTVEAELEVLRREAVSADALQHGLAADREKLATMSTLVAERDRELTSASRRLERADAEVARLEAEVRHLAGAAAELAVARDRIQQLKRHRHDLRERLGRVHASRGYRMIVAYRRVRAGLLRPFRH